MALILAVGDYCFFAGDQNQSLDLSNLSSLWKGLFLSFLVFAVIFVFNLIAAPSRIDKEQTEEIDSLKKAKSDKSENAKIATNLHRLVKEGQHIEYVFKSDPHLGGGFGSAYREFFYKWVVKTNRYMKLVNIPYDERLMFDTISNNRPADHEDFIDSLSAKINKLRLIMGRAAEGTYNEHLG